MMTHIFQPMIGKNLEVYRDDCYVISDTWKEHKEHLIQFLELCKANQLVLADHKFELVPSEATTLGKRIDSAGIKIDPKHVEAIVTVSASRMLPG